MSKDNNNSYENNNPKETNNNLSSNTWADSTGTPFIIGRNDYLKIQYEIVHNDLLTGQTKNNDQPTYKETEI